MDLAAANLVKRHEEARKISRLFYVPKLGFVTGAESVLLLLSAVRS